jgi:hypothetical protein
MAYDESLAERIREQISGTKGLIEKQMFGGLAFLVRGHMAIAASGQGGLLVRVPPERTDEFVGRPGVARFEMRGRPMDGWLRVEPGAARTSAQLKKWITLGVEYAQALPPK